MNILAICGAGMGTSVIMKIKLTQFSQENNMHTTVESCGLDEGKGSLGDYDVVICSVHLVEELGDIPPSTTLLAVENIMDIAHYGDKIKTLYEETVN